MWCVFFFKEKCHQYWPSERSARYQYFVVDPMAEYNMPQYILREFKVTDARVSLVKVTVKCPIYRIMHGAWFSGIFFFCFEIWNKNNSLKVNSITVYKQFVETIWYMYCTKHLSLRSFFLVFVILYAQQVYNWKLACTCILKMYTWFHVW